MKSKSYSNIGFSSIMVVFVTIAFLSFGVLSLMTARADYKLTEKNAERNKDYYNVVSDSEHLLSELDTAFSQLYSHSLDETDYYHLIAEYLSEDNGNISAETENFSYDTEARSLTYTIRVSSLQVLSVQIDVLYPDGNTEDHFYKIANEKTYTDMEEEATEEPLHLLGGN
ncbi:MAG: hypothetical protein K6F37_00305 [Lachnospiraceae bacterium]|nr:hypothetical protein [Lachnospiraceae bacterium]